MSVFRNLLDKQRNPKPLAHYNFEGYTNTNHPDKIPDLTGNGYDLSPYNLDYNLMSGFGGYTDDWTRYRSGDPNKTDHTAEVSNTTGQWSWFWGNSNFQPGETIPAQIVKVTGLDPDASYKLTYNNYTTTITFPGDGIYLLPAGENTGDTPVLGIGLYINNPNKEYINHVTAEQLPLYPGCFVASPTDDGNHPYLLSTVLDPTLFNLGKGFTIISQRSVEPTNDISYLYFSGGKQAQRRFEERLNADSEESAVISFSKQSINIPTKYRGIVTFTSTVFNGTPISKGDIVQSDSSGIYFGQESNTFKGGMREFYLFNRDLTQAQIERFISENMLPDPLVYYDVRKQNTKNSDTHSRGTLIDLSGNRNHGVLNNFDYSTLLKKVYLEGVDSFILANTSESKLIERDGYLINIVANVAGSQWLWWNSVDTTSGSYTTEEYTIKVTGMTQGVIKVIPWGINVGGYYTYSDRIEIEHDGVYTIPSVSYDVPEGYIQHLQNLVTASTAINSGITVEYLPTPISESGGDYIDDVLPIQPNENISIEGHEITITSDYSKETNGLFIAGSKVDTSNEVVQVPAMRLKVTNLVSGEIHIGYVNGGFVNQLTIVSDGTYYIPQYDVPPSTGGNRRVWTIYSYYDSNNVGVNSGVVIETLPVQRDGWVETYIDDEIPLVLNPTNAGDSTYANHVLMVRNNLNGWVLMANPVDRDTQIKSFRVRVSGLTDRYVSFRTGENQNLMSGITSDGVYTVPAHVEKSGYRPIVIAVSEGASCTIEFLPQTDYIQFDGVDDSISIPSLTEGFKTMCMLTEGPDALVRFYDQRDALDQEHFTLFSSDRRIAYNARSTGQTYINGELNTSTYPSDLKGDQICIIHRNDEVTTENSSTPYIGVRYTGDYNGPIKLSKFLGFREYLSDTQIKKVIEKYGLLEGVSPVEEDPLKDIHYVADWDAKGRSNSEEGGGISKWIDKATGKVITLNNFSFSEMSGWNGYAFDWSKWNSDIESQGGTIVKGDNKIIVKNFGNNPAWTIMYDMSVSISPCKIRISGLSEGKSIYSYSGNTSEAASYFTA